MSVLIPKKLDGILVLFYDGEFAPRDEINNIVADNEWVDRFKLKEFLNRNAELNNGIHSMFQGHFIQNSVCLGNTQFAPNFLNNKNYVEEKSEDNKFQNVQGKYFITKGEIKEERNTLSGAPGFSEILFRRYRMKAQLKTTLEDCNAHNAIDFILPDREAQKSHNYNMMFPYFVCPMVDRNGCLLLFSVRTAVLWDSEYVPPETLGDTDWYQVPHHYELSENAKYFDLLKGFDANIDLNDLKDFFKEEEKEWSMSLYSPRIGSSMIGAYPLTKAQMHNFSSDLWDTSFLELFKGLFLNDQKEAIIGLKWFYGINSIIPRAKYNCKIAVGKNSFDSVTTKPVSSDFAEKVLKPIEIKKRYDSYLDYAPYTKIRLFIPFLGYREVNTNDVMGGKITIKYRINVISGETVILVLSSILENEPIIIDRCSMGVEVPLSGSDMKDLQSQLVSGISSVGSMAAGVATSNPALIATGVVGITSNFQQDSFLSGGFNQDTGHMGKLTAHAIIERPMVSGNDAIKHTMPMNKECKVKDAGNGLVKFLLIYPGSVEASNRYNDEILGLLQRGVYL